MRPLTPYVLLGMALRTVIILLVVLLIGTRLIGKREIGQTAPFDLISLWLIASVVPNLMTGPNISVTGGLTAIATLFVPMFQQWEHAPDTASARTLAMDRGVPHTRSSPFPASNG